jgi:hypothetical protein
LALGNPWLPNTAPQDSLQDYSLVFLVAAAAAVETLIVFVLSAAVTD